MDFVETPANSDWLLLNQLYAAASQRFIGDRRTGSSGAVKALAVKALAER
jgi:hypothetical protein